MRAAVLFDPAGPLSLEDVDLAPLGPLDVLVRVVASGVCGSDVHLVEGRLFIPGPSGPQSPPLPIVPGHEAAGVVEEVGAAVRSEESLRRSRGWTSLASSTSTWPVGSTSTPSCRGSGR